MKRRALLKRMGGVAAVVVARTVHAKGGPAEGGGLYGERYRPQFHYTVKKGWINDPCGLVYDAGEYHLFNDHNPFGNRMPGALGAKNRPPSRWSHAVSRDLVHWQEMPIAILPDRLGAIFSGSGVVDAAEVGLRMHGQAVAWAHEEVSCLGRSANLSPVKGVVTLRILLDRTSLEVFGNGGQVSMTSCLLPPGPDTPLELYAKGGEAHVESLTVRRLRSAWDRSPTRPPATHGP